MPKNIVLCMDGTWNNPTKPTNVTYLFNLLNAPEVSRTPPTGDIQEIDRRSDSLVAKYIHGIGDEKFLTRYTAGAFGLGMIGKISTGYSFICKNYEPGDKIFISGFSRGATSARAVADLIASIGILRQNSGEPDEEFAWACELNFGKHVRKIADHVYQSFVINFMQDFRFPKRFENWTEEQLSAHTPKSAQNLKSFNIKPRNNTFDTDATVEAVAVWDTVQALTPLFKSTPFTMNILSSDAHEKILHGYQAISIDENRKAFSPSLWKPRAGIEQCLFPGSHSDVGGGYPIEEQGLSNGALEWMISKLPPDLFAPDVMQELPKPDSLGIAHRSDSDMMDKEERVFANDMKLDVHPSVQARVKQKVSVKFDTQGDVLEEVYGSSWAEPFQIAGVSKTIQPGLV